MRKRRWKRPNEFLWSLVLVIGLFMFSADSFAVLLLALAMMIISCYKLKDMDLSEECNTGLSFTDR
jgi:hypothetical protein